MNTEPSSLTTVLAKRIAEAIAQAGGWIPFDDFMRMALYEPGLGYYANSRSKFGVMPEQGSDFVTAPELSPVFGELVAAQVQDAFVHTQTSEVWEFGAGTGALAEQLLSTLGPACTRYTIVDVSGSLRLRQQERLARFGDQVQWADSLPAQMQGVVVGNEVLDAMPVKLLLRQQGIWQERGVVVGRVSEDGEDIRFAWAERATPLRPPVEPELPLEAEYLTEIHPQGEAFVATLADRITRGAVLLIDYGFGEPEYYHPQRHMGTLVCHHLHQVDSDPLVLVGLKDITAHVNFTGTAVAAQDAGMDVLGYTSQAHFLINCGLGAKLDQLEVIARSKAAKLMMEHEMGEFFKAIMLSKGVEIWEPVGFVQGDRMHRL
ncbi:class I SAM-dependent methyltransferase [Comamonas piscis]|uniref:class I SAM-dependent methyltransferase n=1 Tax=Comamonas piscis TaxID=1562974 RepID=UPI001EE2273B|nr:SAM-dependent methyltransferase [Comamonas piscis]WSO35008.1 SAM-dependent methyltransferase [Comamonas piscis]